MQVHSHFYSSVKNTMAAQIGFQMAFCVTLNATHNDSIKSSDRNAGSIHIVSERG